MITYGERYGDLWEMFIINKYQNRTMTFSHKKLVDLANEFEEFLFKISENLGIAG